MRGEDAQIAVAYSLREPDTAPTVGPRWTEKGNAMDNLARDMVLAKQAGMSYGKWKALQPIAPAKKKDIPEVLSTCEWCGKPFAAKKNKRFCGSSCSDKAWYARSKKGGRSEGK